MLSVSESGSINTVSTAGKLVTEIDVIGLDSSHTHLLGTNLTKKDGDENDVTEDQDDDENWEDENDEQIMEVPAKKCGQFFPPPSLDAAQLVKDSLLLVRQGTLNPVLLGMYT